MTPSGPTGMPLALDVDRPPTVAAMAPVEVTASRPTVQRQAADPAPPSEPAAEPPAAAPAAAEAAPAAPAAPDPGALPKGGDPEELVNQLYGPLVRRLRTELRLDRERRGLLTDRWH
jgi:pyruvate/2-oxoglutarate dehydrogenase complex dihydrolipoamide acyltransferase (E2) component